MPIIKVNDIDMYYESYGEGFPLILISGFSADHTAWYSVTELLSKHFQVIVFDNRGVGQTTVPMGPYTISQMADDVAGLCHGLNILKAHFIGSSMGGFILQMLADRYPTLVKSVILSNSLSNVHTCFHYYVGAELELRKAGAPAEALIKASCSWAFSYQFLTQPGIFDMLLEWGLNNPFPFSITGFEGQYAALSQFDSSAWVGDIHQPVLVIAADQDLIFSEVMIKAFALQIPHSEYVGFVDCGHLPHIEYPEKYVEIVMNFIQKR